jgi:hypothetical protein
MKEDLLQYIWQFQYFNFNNLMTTESVGLQVIHPGIKNYNAGPDFNEAKIRIGDTLWAGNVELHINSSDWVHHHHGDDENYKNIILHVVWKQNKVIRDVVGNDIPTLELCDRVSKILLDKYQGLMDATGFIPCENQVTKIEYLTRISWKERLLAERLIARSARVIKIFEENNHHWEETFWILLASNFGLKVNSLFFENIARFTPLKVLARHKHNIHQLEALLFGQAGLLKQNFTDKYPVMLQQEYSFLHRKYKLDKPPGSAIFLRMRPANFPTIRLAQLAMLIFNSEHLFSQIKAAGQIHELKKMFTVQPNDYWNYHYIFGEEAPFRKKTLGHETIQNILINTVAPVMFTYGQFNNEKEYKEKAIYWLENLGKEKNHITRNFERLGFTNSNAADSQALLELKKHYCDKKRCLHCAIGNFILKRNQSKFT